MQPLMLLQINLMLRAFVVICQFSGILSELEITFLPESFCLLQPDNETGIESSMTVYGNRSRSCDLQINASSSQVLISIVANNMTDLDYIYIERIWPRNMYSNHVVAFMEPLLEQCKACFVNSTIQLHISGNVMVNLLDIILEKDHPPGCPEYLNKDGTVGAHEGQTNCKRVKEFNSVIGCLSVNHDWWLPTDHTYVEAVLKSELSTRCDVQCPDNCSCILSDRQVIYNCPQNIQHLGKQSTVFVLISTNITFLTLRKNKITALLSDTFANIGKHIRYLDLAHNSLSSLPLGLFDKMYWLLFIDLEHNLLAFLNAVLFDHLYRLFYFSFEGNQLEQLDGRLLDNLGSLRIIFLSDNVLKTLDKGVFSNFYVLVYLLIMHNSISILESQIFHNLHNLRSLNLMQIKSNIVKLAHSLIYPT